MSFELNVTVLYLIHTIVLSLPPVQTL